MAQRSGPPRRIRYLGRAINDVAVRAPWAWPVARPIVERFFNASAPVWDERVEPDSAEHLSSIERGLESIPDEPRSALDIGTGTGSVALMLKRRHPGAEVLGVDLAARMISAAQAKAAAARLDVRFETVDVRDWPAQRRFDLITMLNMPPFFEPVSNLLEPGGYLIHAASSGSRTPFYTSERRLRRGFERRGLITVAAGSVGAASYYVARRPA